MCKTPSNPESAIIIIPARLASTRFPQKVLAEDTGQPLVWHVYEAAIKATCAKRVIIATDHQKIADAVLSRGGQAIMTRPDHPNGTSRLAQVAADLNLNENQIIVNVQGDEPELDPALIDAAVEQLVSTHADISTIASPMTDPEVIQNPAVVKVVLKADSTAMYFSRSPIPSHARTTHAQALRHVGLYAYRVKMLLKYAALPSTPLEQTERLEQLRALEHGMTIAVAIRPSSHSGIDTPEQYQAFVDRYTASS